MRHCHIGYLALTLTLLVTWTFSEPAVGATADPKDIHYDYPVGDPRRCIQQAQQTKMNLNRFEVLPGIGWDNLQNLEMGVVVRFNYSQCKVTDDGRFLIPDNVNALPIKYSYVETFAELIDSYLHTTSSTSSSINVQAGLSLSIFAASGSYSKDHQVIKSKQIEDKAVTTRVQLRYHRYEARLEPEPELDPQFKKRCLNIAGNLMLNNTEQALYDGQLIIRDYGTHVQTSVMAGAGLVKTDFLKKSFVGTDETEKTNILAQASASFFSIFHVGGTYRHSTSTSTSTKYNQSMTHSYLTTHGGGLMGANTSLDVWTKSVDTNLVAMDRSGDPLNFLITPQLFPELPKPTLAELEEVIRDSIVLYYEVNTIRGCTKMSSPNFNPTANFEDGTCKAKATNFTFGGVYQTCAITSGQYLNDNPCKDLNQANPITGGSSCSAGYIPVEIFTGSRKSPTETRRSCHSCWIFATCCHTDQFSATATYHTYWCAATGHVTKDTGYMFGGLYTTQLENPVTGAHNCPEKFYALHMFTDLHICLSDEYELDIGVPFGGLFSCHQGNPLAVPGVRPVGSNDLTRHSLRAFMANKSGHPDDKWPKKCPQGYSQHVATVEQGCAIHYCVKSGALSGPLLPPVKRPPFSVAPPALIEDEKNLVMFNLRDQTWLRDEDARLAMAKVNPRQSTVHSDGSGDSLSAGAAAGIAVGVMVALMVVAFVGFVLVKKRRQRRSSYHSLTGQETNERQALRSGPGGSTETPS